MDERQPRARHRIHRNGWGRKIQSARRIDAPYSARQVWQEGLLKQRMRFQKVECTDIYAQQNIKTR